MNMLVMGVECGDGRHCGWQAQCVLCGVWVWRGCGWLCSAALGSGVGVTSLFNLYGNETSYLSAQTCRLAAHRRGQANL
ncbi:hypothetical protein E2C01_021994 [Portunus trituberculatus]|uniref:Uncharacterized protein n=1 Tax=Portunus trituberculatus TaxID=210409 RepID=A0A5B7E6G3_PORTR|nr:hypothetical protein [Portunus trituberculatus]